MKIRIARHTSCLISVSEFYTMVLGFEMLGSFKDHKGYDGIFLGLPGKDWHLEYTCNGRKPNHVSDADDLLVLYPDDDIAYNRIMASLKS